MRRFASLGRSRSAAVVFPSRRRKTTCPSSWLACAPSSGSGASRSQYLEAQPCCEAYQVHRACSSLWLRPHRRPPCLDRLLPRSVSTMAHVSLIGMVVDLYRLKMGRDRHHWILEGADVIVCKYTTAEKVGLTACDYSGLELCCRLQLPFQHFADSRSASRCFGAVVARKQIKSGRVCGRLPQPWQCARCRLC